jgi:hypothetical protein
MACDAVCLYYGGAHYVCIQDRKMSRTNKQKIVFFKSADMITSNLKYE